MKNIISYFIKFPVAVNLVMILVLIFGYMSLSSIQTTFFPNRQMPYVYIDAVYLGASPEEVEEGVILKIEDNLKSITGVVRITSVAQENMGKVTVEMDADADLDNALVEIKNAVESIPSFPKEVESVISYKHEGKNFSISIGITGEEVSLKALKETARKVERDFMQHEGISKVTLSGFPEEEIVVKLDRARMEAYQLTFEEVSRAVSRANLNLTGGSIKDGEEEFFIRAKQKRYSAKELDNIVVKSSNNTAVVRLKDIAKVVDQWEDNPAKVLINGVEGVMITVENTFEEDVLSTTAFVRGYVDDFNASNTVLEASVVKDQSVILDQRLELLLDNGIFGIVLVFVFLSMFLNPRIAFWVAIGIPFSILGMFIVIAFTSVTINMISLFALIVVLGILVDDAIVVAENIYQHYEQGKTPVKAAIDGTMEVLPAVLSAVITTMMAFSIFIFIDGVLGDFFSEMTIIVVVILAVSLVEGLIVLPAHIAHSKALKQMGKKPNKLAAFAEQSMSWIRDHIYAPALRFSLRNKVIALSIPTALFIVSIGMLGGGIVPMTFFPHVEGDDVNIQLALTTGTSEKVTQKWVTYIEDKIQQVNDDYKSSQPNQVDIVYAVNSQINGDGSSASIDLTLISAEKRAVATFEIISVLQQEIGVIPGVEKLKFGSLSPFGTPIDISLQGDDLEMLDRVKNELKQEMKTYPELRDVSDNSPIGSREISIDLKEKAHLLGVSLHDVISQVRQGFYGAEVQRLQRGQDEVKVWVRFDEENRMSFGDLENMKIRLGDGSSYPLQELADFHIDYGYSAIRHIDLKREMRVSAELTNPDASVPDIMAKIDREILNRLLEENPGLEVNYDGQKREQMKMVDSMKIVVPTVFLLMLAVVIFTLRSVSQSILLFALIPLSLVGVVTGHFIHGMAVNLISFLGIIALIGVMINDSLVLINALNINLKNGMPFEEALTAAGLSRFRPILLTTLTTVAGMGPMVFETSMQARFLIPMVLSVAYGISAATLITLFVLPVMLSLINSAKRNISWLKTGEKPSAESVEAAVKEKQFNEQHDLEVV